MKGKKGERIWLFHARPGVWSSGPMVIHEETLRVFPDADRMIPDPERWDSDGPYVRADDEELLA